MALFWRYAVWVRRLFIPSQANIDKQRQQKIKYVSTGGPMKTALIQSDVRNAVWCRGVGHALVKVLCCFCSAVALTPCGSAEGAVP